MIRPTVDNRAPDRSAAENFDYDGYWEALEHGKARMTPSLRTAPVQLREWRWPVLGAYNGYSGEERVRGWQISCWMHSTGLLSQPPHCNICGGTNQVRRHSEDYYCILTAPGLCKGCHYAVHQRFNKPDMWKAFAAKHAAAHRIRHGDAAPLPWFALLPAWPIDLASYVRDRFGPGVTDLFASPLYSLPNGFPLPRGELYGRGLVTKRPPARARSRNS